MTFPSGEWDVRKLGLKPILPTSASAATLTKMQFSDQLGAPVKLIPPSKLRTAIRQRDPQQAHLGVTVNAAIGW